MPDDQRYVNTFPTRRSSDLAIAGQPLAPLFVSRAQCSFDQDTLEPAAVDEEFAGHGAAGEFFIDRKSTRLNSSHSSISYAVFCLKKKNYYSPQSRLMNTGILIMALHIITPVWFLCKCLMTNGMLTLSLHDALPISRSQGSHWLHSSYPARSAPSIRTPLNPLQSMKNSPATVRPANSS